MKTKRKKKFVSVEMDESKWYSVGSFDSHECCGCSLIHDVEYKFEKGRLFTRWKVNKKVTDEQRAQLGIKVIRGN